MRRLPALLSALAAVLLLSGCFRLDVAVEVRDDGSGTVREVFAVDRRLASATPGDAAGAGDLVSGGPAVAALPTWAVVRPYRDGSLEGVSVDVAFSDAEQLGQRLRRVNRVLTERAGTEVDSTLVLEPVDGGWRFRATPDQLGLVADLTLPGQRVDPDRFADAEVFLAVRLPGHVIAHNGDRQDGNLVSWRVDLDGSSASELFAESRPRPVPATTRDHPASGWLAFAVGAAALGGAVVLAASSRAGRRAVSTAAATNGTQVGTAIGTPMGTLHGATMPTVAIGSAASWPSAPPAAPPTATPDRAPGIAEPISAHRSPSG